MRETSSPLREMCFMAGWLLVVVEDLRRVQESTGSREVRVPVDRGTGRVSHAERGGATLRLWTPERRSLSSRPPPAPGSPQNQPGCPPPPPPPFPPSPPHTPPPPPRSP